MDFVRDSAIICTLIGIMATLVMTMSSNFYSWPHRPPIWLTALKFSITLAALYCAANVAVFGLSASSNGANRITHPVIPYAEASVHFGLESGRTYPLKLGSRFAGTSGQMSVTGGLFSVYGEGSWTPATALSLGFENPDGRNWIIEIPISRATFIKSSSTEPSVKITLRGEGVDLGFSRTTVREPCSLEVQWGWWVCVEGATQITYSASEDAEKNGLAPIMARAFAEGNASAEITLTPEQYDALLKDG